MLNSDFIHRVRLFNLGLCRELFDPGQKTVTLLDDRINGNTSKREDSPE